MHWNNGKKFLHVGQEVTTVEDIFWFQIFVCVLTESVLLNCLVCNHSTPVAERGLNGSRRLTTTSKYFVATEHSACRKSTQ